MSFTDMANLKKENVGAKSIRYKRKKTGQLITVETEDCMKEIIDRYADADSDYLFPILGGITDEYAKWKKTNAALTRYNKNLKKLAASAGLDVPLTGYVARHSWASAASQEGIPIATISRGMGHESEKTTRIYISQLDFSDVGRANRQVISRILSPRNG
jgi:integrase